MKCPSCKRILPDVATTCRCGWTAHEKTATSKARGPLPCEWSSGGELCHYPASMSSNTHEGGPWYCSLHFSCGSAAFGATVVEASRDYRHPTQAEIEAEELVGVRERLAEKGLDRQPGESVKDWMKRTSEWMRGKGPKTFRNAA